MHCQTHSPRGNLHSVSTRHLGWTFILKTRTVLGAILCAALTLLLCPLSSRSDIVTSPTPGGVTIRFDLDDDNDGLPNDWELAHALDPGSAHGDDGTWGDPDWDGLCNVAEFNASTESGLPLDPHQPNSLGNDLPDFFAWGTVGSNRFRIFGEPFTDFDGMADLWESTLGLDPRAFDAHLDTDSDGWRNRSEFLADVGETAIATNGPGHPTNAALFPSPEISINFTYSGTHTNGTTRVLAWHSPAMDGLPDAELTLTNLPGPWPQSTSINTWDTGRIREGATWFWAYLDNNTNGTWNVGEPAGLSRARPTRMGWGPINNFEIDLSDSQPHASQPNYALPGYGRFAWTAQPTATACRVIIRNVSLAGSPVVLDRTLSTSRTWLHEGDYQFANLPGLPQATFQWFAYSKLGVVESLFTNGIFTVIYPASLTAPVPVTPESNTFTFARNQFIWSGSTGATRFQFQLATNATFTTPITNAIIIAPIPDQSGQVQFQLPLLAGDERLPPGKYFWRVRALNPQFTSSYSTARTCFFDLADQSAGPYAVAGTLSYFGKATRGHFVIQALSNPGFGQTPLAQVTVTNASSSSDGPRHNVPFRVAGLPAGTCFLRGFLDQDGDRDADDSESAGFVRTNFYLPMPLNLTATVSNLVLSLTPVDTDNDRVGDDWEFQYFGNLTTVYNDTNQVDVYTDNNSDGLDDFKTYAHAPIGVDPQDPNAAGADGIAYRVKDAFGLDPLTDFFFSLTDVKFDSAVLPTMMWPSLPGGTATGGTAGHASQSNNGVTLHYQIESSPNLQPWSNTAPIGPVDYLAPSNCFLYTDPLGVTNTGFYRFRVSWTN